MESIFSAKIKILYIIIFTCAAFAYFKYIKKDTLNPMVGLIIGFVFLAVGIVSGVIFYAPETVAKALMLNSDINWGIEKMIFMSYSFLLLALMSFVERNIFNK